MFPVAVKGRKWTEPSSRKTPAISVEATMRPVRCCSARPKGCRTWQHLICPCGGVDRRTSKMMKADLKAARKKWIEEAQTRKQKAEREASDFLRYKDSAGKFADFHSNRHTFITNLEHVGVSPRTAQSLARHCDIRLTTNRNSTPCGPNCPST